MVLASLSQLALSSGVVAAICPRICRPTRKSERLKAVSASPRRVAEDLATGPASLLICASSLTAEIGQLVALERLVRGASRRQAKRQRGANHCGANQTDHDGLLAADISRVTSKRARKGDGLMAGNSGLRKGRMHGVGSPNGPGRTARRGAGGWLCVRGGRQGMAHRLP